MALGETRGTAAAAGGGTPIVEVNVYWTRPGATAAGAEQAAVAAILPAYGAARAWFLPGMR